MSLETVLKIPPRTQPRQSVSSLQDGYRYSDYGSKSGTYDSGKGTEAYKSKLRDNRATVGLAYKF
jgi:opacity protein-like surface antigen